MYLISPNFDVESIIFSQFLPGTFSQNCWKKPSFIIEADTMQTTKVVIGGKSVTDLLLYIVRCRGAIVMVSSGACSQITPLMTVYAGTKVNHFTEK